MERKEVKKINSLLEEYVRAYNLEDGLAEYRIMKSWRELLGVSVSKKTRDLSVRNRKLIVTLHSSVIRNELSMMKESLIARLNAAAGKSVIDDIVLR
ncbi:MAG: DUF721 domain-containing protein [Bacteroidales bacterium]|nr:DUF721 domain-containing protein [Bacteroidales bacterium]MBN2697880.1 DUF721 domain-containing protein [Bacteroidales bacterium]